jgi:hypothetical protein
MNPNLTPRELLEEQLKEFERSLEKSKEFLKKDLIPDVIHEEHLVNLYPKIQAYKLAIRVLDTYL